MKRAASDWKYIGETSNTVAYEVRDDLIALVPNPGTRDTVETARENLDIQRRHWQNTGRSGACAIFMDNVVEQTPEARKVYSTESSGLGTVAFALIGETSFGRAASTVYTGLSKPVVATQLFPSLEEALPWIDEAIKATA